MKLKRGLFLFTEENQLIQGKRKIELEYHNFSTMSVLISQLKVISGYENRV
jgi:hypothetical protein